MKTYIAPRIEVIRLDSESSLLTASGINQKHDLYSPGEQLTNRHESGWDSSLWSRSEAE